MCDVLARGCIAEFDTVGRKFEIGDKEKIEAAVQGTLNWLDNNQLAGGAEVYVGRVMNGAGVSVCNQVKCLMVVSHVPEEEC